MTTKDCRSATEEHGVAAEVSSAAEWDFSTGPGGKGRERVGYGAYAEHLDELVQVLSEELGDNLISVVVYGSVARGHATPSSDLDVVLVLREAPGTYYERLRPCVRALRRLRSAPGARRMRERGLRGEPSLVVLTQEEALEPRLLYLDMVQDAVILRDRGGFFRERLRHTARRLEELGSRRVPVGRGWYWELKPDRQPGETVVL